MKKQHLTLSELDLTQLKSLTSRGNLSAKKFNRARGLMGLHEGKTFKMVSQECQVSYQTVSTWCKKYKASGLDFLEDAPRSGRPKAITTLQKAQITALACSNAPEERSKWTLRLLADKIVELGYVESISHTEVGRILKKTNLNHT